MSWKLFLQSLMLMIAGGVVSAFVRDMHEESIARSQKEIMSFGESLRRGETELDRP